MIVTDSARVGAFVGERVGSVLVAPFVAIGLERDGELVAGCVFNCYTGPDIQATVAVDRGAVTRGYLRALGEYAFRVAGCERVTIETEHLPVVELARRLGGKIEGIKHNALGVGRHGVIVGILKADWKY